MQSHSLITRSMLLLLLISIGGTGILIFNYGTRWHTAHAKAIKQAQQTTHTAAQELEQFIAQLRIKVQQLVHERSTETYPTDVKELIQRKPIDISGLGIITENSTSPFAWYYVEYNDQQTMVDLTTVPPSSTYDIWHAAIIDSTTEYYGPLTDPVTGQESIVYVLSYTDPVYGHAYAFATLSFDHIRHVMNTLYRSTTTSLFITDQEGNVVLHPNPLSSIGLSPALQAGVEDAYLFRADHGIHAYTDATNGQQFLLAYERLNRMPWILCGIMTGNNDTMDARTQRHLNINLIIACTFTLLCAIAYLVFYATANNRPINRWLIMFFISLICMGATAAVWYVVRWHPHYQDTVIPIGSKKELYTFLDKLPQQTTTALSAADQTIPDNAYYLRYRYRQQRYVPTGIFVQYVQFTTDNQVTLVGFVWQRYFAGIHDGIERGFILPQATTYDAPEKIYHTKTGKEETIIWRINATLNQAFDYTRYPFDARDIHVQLWHADFGQNLVLVPDLDAYTTIIPAALPGLNLEAQIPNWNLQESRYGYENTIYTTSFGLYAYGPFGIYREINRSQTPELYFTIKTRRLLTDTLLDDLFPLILVALILFVIFFTDIPQGFQVFAAYTTVFFGLVMAQLHFRSKIASNQLTYFETLYFIMYAAMLVAVILTVLALLYPDHQQLKRFNYLTKLIFWPLVFGATLIITVLYLY